MMLYLLPLWLPDFALGLPPLVIKWVRLICGAVGAGIGCTIFTVLVVGRLQETLLWWIAAAYFVLGVYNVWLSSRRLTSETIERSL